MSARLRRDNPEVDIQNKPQYKYLSPYGDTRLLYYPPGAREKLADSTTPILLVEAEKSALALTAWAERMGRKLLVLAMGGCWSWKGRIGKTIDERGVRVDVKGILRDFHCVDGREVTILLDANAAINPNVQRAEQKLRWALLDGAETPASEFSSKKQWKAASVRICRLPQADGVNGPDDYLGKFDDEAMAAVVDGRLMTGYSCDPNDPRRPIYLSADNRELATVAEEFGAALRGRLYVHGEEIVEPRGSLLQPVKPQTFRTLIAREIACLRHKEKRKDVFVTVLVTMSEAEAAGILASPQFREQLLPITQVNLCRLPILRSAGKVELLPEGYDQATETLTVSTIDYRDDMLLDEAVTLVRDLYDEFEFADGERSLAVTLAGGLTLFTPHLLPEGAHRPCFVVNKNAEGAGATTLARCMTTPVLGTVAFNALPGNQDEMRKLLTSIVCAGKQSLIFDNVSGFLKSPPLEAFLTSPRSGDRGLGGNRLIEAPNLATVYVTGNGLTLSSDMTRRSLQIELHLSYEHAGEREFKRRLDAASPGLEIGANGKRKSLPYRLQKRSANSSNLKHVKFACAKTCRG